MYDIKQVTRYVLVRKRYCVDGGDHSVCHEASDIAEFKRRDEAESALDALNGKPAGIRGATAQQDATKAQVNKAARGQVSAADSARTVFHDGVCLKNNYGKLAQWSDEDIKAYYSTEGHRDF